MLVAAAQTRYVAAGVSLLEMVAAHRRRFGARLRHTPGPFGSGGGGGVVTMSSGGMTTSGPR